MGLLSPTSTILIITWEDDRMCYISALKFAVERESSPITRAPSRPPSSRVNIAASDHHHG